MKGSTHNIYTMESCSCFFKVHLDSCPTSYLHMISAGSVQQVISLCPRKHLPCDDSDIVIIFAASAS